MIQTFPSFWVHHQTPLPCFNFLYLGFTKQLEMGRKWDALGIQRTGEGTLQFNSVFQLGKRDYLFPNSAEGMTKCPLLFYDQLFSASNVQTVGMKTLMAKFVMHKNFQQINSGPQTLVFSKWVLQRNKGLKGELFHLTKKQEELCVTRLKEE